MGEQVAAVLIDKVEGTQPTDDKSHVLIKTTTGGTETIYAIKPDQLLRLFDSGAASIAQALDLTRAVPGQRTQKPSFEASWFELGRHPDGGLVLSLTFGAGGVLSFRLPDQMPNNLLEVLQSALGKSEPLGPFTKQ